MLLKEVDQDLEEKIAEYDFWVTPSLVQIRNTKRFQQELLRVTSVLETLAVGSLPKIDSTLFVQDVTDRVIEHLRLIDSGITEVFKAATPSMEFLNSLSAFLFMVTGKSDNNNKCQFPIFLRNTAGLDSIPNLRVRRGKIDIVYEKIPRVLDSECFMARVSKLFAADEHLGLVKPEGGADIKKHANPLLFQFISVLLDDLQSRKQLLAYLGYYSECKKKNQGRALAEQEDPADLLTPLVMFQVRGSVAASGGHEPEEILRNKMIDWGLIKGIDFNLNDVVLKPEIGRILEVTDQPYEVPGKLKTRAYDFVFPYRTPGWYPHIFVQSQFYAGDSGSVSHKNVDQTRSSRRDATELLQELYPNLKPVFLELVDGAGYSASLNGDLKSLLKYQDTKDFFQLRSANLRLRRELQQIGFLTPLEVAHAALRAGGEYGGTVAILQGEGYVESEINRAIQVAQGANLIHILSNGDVEISMGFMPIVKQHLLLDIVAYYGVSYPSLLALTGVVLVPGYGPYHGTSLTELDRLVREYFPNVWPAGFLADLQSLCNAGLVVMR